MNTKIKVLAAAVGLALGMASFQATAAITWYSPYTLFEDDNIDFFLDRDGEEGVLNTTPSRTGTLNVGDVTVAVFELNQTVSILPAGSSTLITGGELTGIVANQVLTKTAIGPDSFAYTFGAVAEGLNSILGLAGVSVPDGGQAGGGAQAALWFDTSGDDLDVVAVNCGSFIGCMEMASDGVLWEVDGFDDDEDNFWNAQGGDNIGDIATSIAQDLASIQYGLSVLTNGTGQELLPVPCAPNATCTDGAGDEMVFFLGGGNLHGGAGLDDVGAFARSDFDFIKSVPEPATLALLGMGLLGMGVSMRKRKA